MKKIILALLLMVCCAPLALSDTIYLRDGRSVRGTVLGFIGGRFAVRVATTSSTTGTTADTGEVQFFRPNQIERVEIDGRSLDEARFSSRTVEVGLAPNWIDSGVDVRRGERVEVKASGTIVAGRSRITPGGLRSTDPTAPLPRAAEGVLIGAIGNEPDSPIIEIGIGREFVADRDGRLYLTANRGSYSDARGAYSVQVRTERNFTSRRRDNNTASRNDEELDDDIFGSRSTNPAPVRSRERGGDNRGTIDPDRNRSPREVTVDVPGNSRGTDTGVELRSGDQVSISASGTIIAGRRAGEVTPDGGRVSGLGIVSAYPVPNAGVGALIGYIRLSNGQNTAPFVIGSQQNFGAQADGRLFLLINDDNYNDNSGNFNVRIRVN
ncbi:MAG TPA: LecA/PA-IL family lectin [Pyrinomonadaceae bacterium]|nr:LecA/PA-IL family lectin [Pyrinomonadaceae bacterium]